MQQNSGGHLYLESWKNSGSPLYFEPLCKIVGSVARTASSADHDNITGEVGRWAIVELVQLASVFVLPTNLFMWTWSGRYGFVLFAQVSCGDLVKLIYWRACITGSLWKDRYLGSWDSAGHRDSDAVHRAWYCCEQSKQPYESRPRVAEAEVKYPTPTFPKFSTVT